MAFPSVTYSFSNATTADATQVNQNFTDLINGASDGTKSYNISAITAAGTATLNGNVVAGASSSNSLTVNASLGSSVLLTTTNAYDIGSDTFGLRALYLGSGSSAHSTKIAGASVSAAWVLTLPNGVPTFKNSMMVSDTSGVTTWAQRASLGITTGPTTTYQILGSDEFVPFNASGAGFTATLPSPSATGVSGKVLYLFKNDSSFANAVTVTHNSAEKIYGFDATLTGVNSFTLNTPGEMVALVTDGTSWYVKAHTYPQTWTSFTPSFNNGGTVANNAARYRRVGSSLEIQGYVTLGGTAPASPVTFTLPNSVTSDNSWPTANVAIGAWACNTTTAFGGVMLLNQGANTTVGFGFQGAASAGLTIMNGSSFASIAIGYSCSVPISGWTA